MMREEDMFSRPTMFMARIDSQDQQHIQSIVDGYSNGVWLYMKEGDGIKKKYHTHIYLEISKSIASLRQHIQKIIGTGNGAYSLKALKLQSPLEEEHLLPIDALQYIMKEQPEVPPPECYSGITPEEIQMIFEISKNRSKDLKANKKKETPIWKQIYQSVDWQSPPQEYTYIHSLQMNEKDQVLERKMRIDYPNWVVDVVIKYYEEKEVLIRKFQLVSTIQTILLRVSPEYKGALRQSILDSL